MEGSFLDRYSPEEQLKRMSPEDRAAVQEIACELAGIAHNSGLERLAIRTPQGKNARTGEVIPSALIEVTFLSEDRTFDGKTPYINMCLGGAKDPGGSL